MRLRVQAALLCAVLVAVGCSSGPKPAPSTTASGTVNVDGKPLEDGEIMFSIEGKGPMILPIKGGKFEGKVNVGDNAVQIRAYKMGEPIMMDGKPFGDPVKVNYIDEKFNDKSELKSKVDAAGAKDLKFDVESKKDAPAAT
jgi:hypothetical protein